MSRLGSSAATSASLLDRVRRNDQEAWHRLVDLYAPYVLHWCRRHALSSEDVADVFQEVFRSAASRILDFSKGRPGDTLRGWLRTITENKVRDHFRRQAREHPAVGGTEIQRRIAEIPAPAGDSDADFDDAAASGAAPGKDAEPDGTATGDAVGALLHRALAQIRGAFRERTWRAFHETVIAGRSAVDVAGDLAMTAGAVRVAKSRVLQRLREELGDLD